MHDLLSYLKYRLPLIAFFAIASFLTLLIWFLSGANTVYGSYTVLLFAFFLAVILIVDGVRFSARRRVLRSLADSLDSAARELPRPGSAIEADYAELVSELSLQRDKALHALSAAHSDQLEYYTLWVHQIKTPISALTLMLAERSDAEALAIRRELARINQYAGLALNYARLGSPSSDLVFEECDVSVIAREAVRQLSLFFVHGGLTAQIGELPRSVICDKKWLAFIFEQLLSNSVKYTPRGGVRIFARDGSVVVADTGIGIRPEDLPRIFEKGYTGYNGRRFSRASGIGLYLVKRAADALCVEVRAASTPGKGTEITLSFPERAPDS